MIPNINTVEQLSPTSLEVAFIETLIFYTCLDSYDEATDTNGYVYQKTRDGTKAIHDFTALLWKIADKDPCFEQRVDEYADLLKKATEGKNEALTVFNTKQVNNFRTVNRHSERGDKHKSRQHT